MLRRNKAIAGITAKLKYTGLHQRSLLYREKKRYRARSNVSRNFLSLAQCTAFELATWLVAGGLLEDLKNQPCPNPNCSEIKARGT